MVQSLPWDGAHMEAIDDVLDGPSTARGKCQPHDVGPVRDGWLSSTVGHHICPKPVDAAGELAQAAGRGRRIEGH